MLCDQSPPPPPGKHVGGGLREEAEWRENMGLVMHGLLISAGSLWQ